MGENTKISWADHTWNPFRGCSHAKMPDGSDHPGCAKCYAEAMSKRNPAVLGKWGPNGTRVLAAPKTFNSPLKWNERAIYNAIDHNDESNLGKDLGEYQRPRVFVNSLSDLFEDWPGPIHDHKGRQLSRCSCRGCTGFHGLDEQTGKSCMWCLGDNVPLTMDDVRARVFSIIDQCPNIDFLVLTKRPENVRRMWSDSNPDGSPRVNWNAPTCDGGYRHNLWLLTSVSDQATADAMIPELLRCRDLVPVLGVSAEPLLGGIDFRPWLEDAYECDICGPLAPATWLPDGFGTDTRYCNKCRRDDPEATSTIYGCVPFLDWIITGCESNGTKVGRLGSFKSEAEFIDAVRDIDSQCKAVGVAHWPKQMPTNGRVSHDPAEWGEGWEQQMPGERS